MKKREKEPDKFDGKNVDLADYLAHFEQIAKYNKWGYDEMGLQLSTSLRGSAQRLLGDMSSEHISDYYRLVDALKKRFSPSEREATFRCEFRMRKKQKSESISDYAYALRRLVSRAFPKLPMGARDELSTEQFILGLPSSEMQRHVQFGHPSTLDAAISLAVEYEAFPGSSSSSGLSKPRVAHVTETTENSDSVTVCSAKSSSKSSGSTSGLSDNAIQQLIKLTEQNGKIMTEQMTNLTTQINNMNTAVSAMNANPVKTKTKRPKSEIECFRCHERGHYSNECPKRPEKDKNENLNH